MQIRSIGTIGAIGNSYSTASKNKKNQSFKADVRITQRCFADSSATKEQQRQTNALMEKCKTALKPLAPDNMIILVTPIIVERMFKKDAVDVQISTIFKNPNQAIYDTLNYHKNNYIHDKRTEQLEKHPAREIDNLKNVIFAESTHKFFKGKIPDVTTLDRIVAVAKRAVNVAMLYNSNGLVDRGEYVNIVDNSDDSFFSWPSYNPNVGPPI